MHGETSADHRIGRWTLGVVAALALGAFPPGLARAGGGSQNLALVVNPDDPDSLAVANCYIELRAIPASNVIYIPWALDARNTSGLQFKNRILKPALDKLAERGLTEQIDYLVFSSGFPYLIDFVPVYKDQQFAPQLRPTTSLTSATYYGHFVLAERKEMFSLNSNFYHAPASGGASASVAFSGAKQWTPGGIPVENGGLKYLLSTALGVTHGRGNTAEEIIASLRRAKSADGSKPPGTIYYMQNDDIRTKVRQEGYAAAIRELAALGVKAELIPGMVPAGKRDVAGVTTGVPFARFETAGNTLVPGALIDNLTSNGGKLMITRELKPQTRISEFITHGAAGASGAVVEPYAIAAKFPSPALHVHYARGCSLAESFYRATAAPFQLLIIGDPLCQPWALPPRVKVDGLGAGAISGVVNLAPAAAYPDSRRASRFEVFVDGVRLTTTDPGQVLALETAKLADGWHDLRVVAIDNTPVAVQGAWEREVWVKNGEEALQLTAEDPQRFALSATIVLAATATAAGDVEVFHNERTLGVVEGGTGKLSVAAMTLGKGTVKLYAKQAGERPLRSHSLAVEIY